MKDESEPAEFVADRPHAPIIYFEEAPASALTNGLVSVTLSAAFQIPRGGGHVRSDRVITAYLRTNVVGARILRDMLDKVLLLAQPAGTAATN